MILFVLQFYNPRNTVPVELSFRGEKMAKVVGQLAVEPPEEGHRVSGILVKRNFNYHLLAPADLQKYTDMTMSTVTQRQSVFYGGSFQLLQFMISQISEEVIIIIKSGGKNRNFDKVKNRVIGVAQVETVETDEEKKVIRAFGSVDIVCEKRMVTLEWIASPINDMYADAVLSAVLQAETIETPRYIPASARVDKIHFKECLIEMLQDMFGEDSVPKTFSGDRFEVEVDGKRAAIDISSLRVASEDPVFQRIVETACAKLKHSLMPPEAAKAGKAK